MRLRWTNGNDPHPVLCDRHWGLLPSRYKKAESLEFTPIDRFGEVKQYIPSIISICDRHTRYRQIICVSVKLSAHWVIKFEYFKNVANLHHNLLISYRLHIKSTHCIYYTSWSEHYVGYILPGILIQFIPMWSHCFEYVQKMAIQVFRLLSGIENMEILPFIASAHGIPRNFAFILPNNQHNTSLTRDRELVMFAVRWKSIWKPYNQTFRRKLLLYWINPSNSGNSSEKYLPLLD